MAIYDNKMINENLERNILYMFMNRLNSLLLCLIMTGCFMAVGSPVKALAAGQSDDELLKTKIIKAYKEYKTELDISSFDFYINEDKSSIKKVMTEVVNKTTSLFYTSHSYSLEYTGTTGKITKIQLGYAAEYKYQGGSVNKSAIKKASNKINRQITKITSQLKHDMNSVDKALFVHDWIAKNTSYEDKSSDNGRLTEYGVLVKHKGNCQGYSLAYAAVMEKLGISVRFVDSDSMGHVWNQVKIGSKWYNVDVTWDDPVDSETGNNQDGVVHHSFLLASDSYMKSHGYYGFQATDADSKKYDKSYFKNVTSAFDYRGDCFVYMDSSGIYKRTHVNSGSAKCLYKVKGICFIKYNSVKYYYIAYNRIYIFSLKSSRSALVWSPVKQYGYSYYITQIKYSSGKIKYYVINKKKSKQKRGSFEVKKSGLV